jgi:catechol 2,3-dioxygenase-like lactoylglutathione lyase family enzyme
VEHLGRHRRPAAVSASPPSGDGGVVGLDHVQVAAPPGCEAQARRFYGHVLGLEEIPKPAQLAVRGGCWFRVGAQELHVGVTDDFTAATKAHPGLLLASAEGLRAAADRLAEAGAPVSWADESEIPGRVRLHTTDPWGNRLELLADR